MRTLCWYEKVYAMVLLNIELNVDCQSPWGYRYKFLLQKLVYVSHSTKIKDLGFFPKKITLLLYIYINI